MKIKNSNLKYVLIRFFFILLGVSMGLVIMAQFRTVPDIITNPETPVLSLKETRHILYQEQEDLQAEIQNLNEQNEALSNDIKKSNVSTESLKELEKEKALAGQTKVSGDGVIITLDDSPLDRANEESIVHAADIRDVINYLWASEAEAISINDQRVVFTTSIDCVVNTILVNNTKISNPFIIKAIGNIDKIKTIMNSQMNLSDIKNRAKNGLIFEFSYKKNITIEPYLGYFNVTTYNQNIE